jgi:hypothetical protein
MHHRKVDVGLGHLIQVVRKAALGDKRDDLDNLGIGKPD